VDPATSNGLVDSGRPLWPARIDDPLLHHAARLVGPDEEVYRFAWMLVYRGGKIHRQYERIGEALFQNRFAFSETHGVERILIYDLERPEQALAFVTVPEDGEADVLYNCTFDPVAGTTHRVYTFGWRIPSSCYYLYIDPAQAPPRIWDGRKRIL
jgi:hypothetical protein